MLANFSTTTASLRNAHAGVYNEVSTMKRMGVLALRIWLLALLVVTGLMGANQTANAAINVQTVATGLGTNGGPVGIDYLLPTNQILVSVNFDQGLPYNFEVVNTNGTHNQFS